VKTKSSIQISLTGVFAALYAIGVVFLAPISFQVFQVRVADALLPLSMVFGWPAVLGLSIGAFVANFFGGLGSIDMVGGALANFIATLLAWKLAARRSKPWFIVGAAAEIIVVTLIVGSYLSYLFGLPIQVGLAGVLLGSIVAIGILGSLLLFALSTKTVRTLLHVRIPDSVS
jgi:uncharacterized membrane protein